MKPLKPEPVFKTVLRSRLSRLAFGGLLLLFNLALFAEFLAPYHYDSEERTKPYQPPTRIHWTDASGRFQGWPFVYASEHRFNAFYQTVYEEDATRRYPLRFFVRGEPYRMWGLFPFDWHLFGVAAPAKIHILGTDGRGRDLFSRILMGGRISLSVGALGVLISIVMGTFLGGLSGYFGGWVDQFLMRTAEVFMMVPTFYLLLAIRSALPSGADSVAVYFLITYVLGLMGWAPLSRVIRGMVLSLREREFVLASRLLGSSHFRILANHILPHTFSYLLVIVAVALPGYLLAESALSLLGLGIQEPYVSWGMLLGETLSITQLKFHFWMTAPAFVIFFTVLCFNLIGDRLRDVLDPANQEKGS